MKAKISFLLGIIVSIIFTMSTGIGSSFVKVNNDGLGLLCAILCTILAGLFWFMIIYFALNLNNTKYKEKGINKWLIIGLVCDMIFIYSFGMIVLKVRLMDNVIVSKVVLIICCISITMIFFSFYISVIIFNKNK